MRELQALGKALCDAKDDESFVAAMSQVAALFSDRNTVSTFQMRTSGICNEVVRSLSGAKQTRWEAFVRLLTESKRTEKDAPIECALRVLLLKIVAAINNAEGFEMGPLGESIPLIDAGGESRLSKQALRLKFQRQGLASELKDYPNAVMIDPLAPISAVHDFLYPRVVRPQPLTTNANSASTCAGSSSSSSSKAPAQPPVPPASAAATSGSASTSTSTRASTRTTRSSAGASSSGAAAGSSSSSSTRAATRSSGAAAPASTSAGESSRSRASTGGRAELPRREPAFMDSDDEDAFFASMQLGVLQGRQDSDDDMDEDMDEVRDDAFS